nr:E-beta-farnesene synthase [Tanacetum cinerariifolium]
MEQQGNDVASWWPWNMFEVLVRCYGDVMEPTPLQTVTPMKLKTYTFPTERMRSIISMVSISLEGFLPSILLLVVIIVAVVIVAVILVVVVIDVIVGVVIVVARIGVVVVMIIGIVFIVDGGVSHIIKLLFVIIDEQWFDLTKDTLREALQITPVDNNNAFSSPPTPDALINFVNDLGYPKVVKNLSDVVTNDMFQPWRALIIIINLCLTGKTSGFERPRAPVLQILWDKNNLTQHTQGKKKATLIVILSVRFTKLVIYYLQSKHKFHSRPDSLLHLPNEEHVLGYLKFTAKGTKREVFGMPISNELITANIQEEQYYKEYLEKVSKHQRYLASEEGSDLESPAPKPTKATKKSKHSAPKAYLRLPVIKPGIPEKEPRFYDEEADLQRAVEESLKSVHDAPRGPLPPMVIREPDSGKFQPLPEVQGKGKEKVSDEQVAHDLLTLRAPKKESPVEQYIFQRRTPASTEPSDEEVPPMVEVEAQDEGHTGPNPGVPTEGQAGSDPDVSTQLHPEQMDEGFTVTAYPNVQENCKLTVEEHVILEEPASSTGTLSSLQHLAKDFNFGDLFFNDKPYEAENEKTTAQTKAESMVLESPNVHRPLQATATKTTMTTTTTHPPPPQPQQSTTDSMLIKHIDELEHIMVNLIQDKKNLEERLDSHRARLYTLENLDIPQQRLFKAEMKEILHQRIWETNSYKAHEDHMMLYEALEKSMNRDHTKELLKDLAEARRKKKKRHDSSKTPPGSPPHQPPPPPPPAGPSRTSRSPGASGSSQVPPLPPRPPSTNQEGQSHGSTAPSSLKTASSVEYTAWTTTDIRLRPFVSSIPKDLHMDDDMAPDAQAHWSDDDDIENTHIPKVNLQQDWWKPLEEDRHAAPEHAWSIDMCKDYAKTVKNQSKPSNIGHKIGSLHQKPDQWAFFYNNQANEAKCQKIESLRSILAIYLKSKSMEKGKSKFK